MRKCNIIIKLNVWILVRTIWYILIWEISIYYISLEFNPKQNSKKQLPHFYTCENYYNPLTSYHSFKNRITTINLIFNESITIKKVQKNFSVLVHRKRDYFCRQCVEKRVIQIKVHEYLINFSSANFCITYYDHGMPNEPRIISENDKFHRVIQWLYY